MSAICLLLHQIEFMGPFPLFRSFSHSLFQNSDWFIMETAERAQHFAESVGFVFCSHWLCVAADTIQASPKLEKVSLLSHIVLQLLHYEDQPGSDGSLFCFTSSQVCCYTQIASLITYVTLFVVKAVHMN